MVHLGGAVFWSGRNKSKYFLRLIETEQEILIEIVHQYRASLKRFFRVIIHASKFNWNE